MTDIAPTQPKTEKPEEDAKAKKIARNSKVKRYTGAPASLKPMVQSVAGTIPGATIQGVSKKCADAFEDQVAMVVRHIVNIGNHVMNHVEKKTLTQEHIETALKLAMPPTWANKMHAAGTRAVNHCNYFKKEGKSGDAKKISIKKRAKLTLQVPRFDAAIRRMLVVDRMSDTVAVYITGAVEYLLRELVYTSVYFSTINEEERMRLAAKHIAEAIVDHPKFGRFFGTGNIRGGFIPTRWRKDLLSQNGYKTDEQRAQDILNKKIKKEKEAKEGKKEAKKKPAAKKGGGVKKEPTVKKEPASRKRKTPPTKAEPKNVPKKGKKGEKTKK